MRESRQRVRVCFQVDRLRRVARQAHTRTFRPGTLASLRFVPGFCRDSAETRDKSRALARKPGSRFDHTVRNIHSEMLAALRLAMVSSAVPRRTPVFAFARVVFGLVTAALAADFGLLLQLAVHRSATSRNEPAAASSPGPPARTVTCLIPRQVRGGGRVDHVDVVNRSSGRHPLGEAIVERARQVLVADFQRLPRDVA